ncbi:MAG: hypothetical protein EON58_00590 [Alphaproteobacteria bacterium]|nr:MAG: hypothetical protein EON58_00590 [Alphaproteobacteria bacterium]
MRAMQAAAFVGYDNLELVDVQKPVATDGKLLVRNTAAGVTPLDNTMHIHHQDMSGKRPFSGRRKQSRHALRAAQARP